MDLQTFALGQNSPLDSLVRRTPSRGPRPVDIATSNHSPQPNPSSSTWHSDAGTSKTTPPRRPRRPPSSPLLHTQFRASTATDLTYFNNPPEDASHHYSIDGHEPYHDDQSFYSSRSQSTYDPSQFVAQYETPDDAPSHSEIELPTVIVSRPRDSRTASAPDVHHPTHPPPFHSHSSYAGKAPSIIPAGYNFSRPVRPPVDAKQRVLERNAHRHPSAPSSPAPSQHVTWAVSPRGATQGHTPLTSESQSTFLDPSLTSPPFSAMSRTDSTASNILSPSISPSVISPSPGNQSPTSPYSTYSFYQYDDVISSPAADKLQFGTAAGIQSEPGAQASYPSSPATQPTQAPTSTTALTIAQQYLQEGIELHEANKLKESAVCFEKSAKEQGGCGAGMLMWGLTLRHGWGCEKNEKIGFSWLRKAAELALDDFQITGEREQRNAIKSELVIAIYEVGQCFFQGWGVIKDQKMAVNYFNTAAKLGDADAQQDLAFCLANGKGCKKDRKEAAKWYRAAIAQGASDVGLAWVYKAKYN